MIAKAKALWDLMHKGRMVANPAAWKKGQIQASMIVALIWAAVHTAEAFGYGVPIGSETVDAVAVGLLALVSWLLTVATSEKVGLPTRPEDQPSQDA